MTSVRRVAPAGWTMDAALAMVAAWRRGAVVWRRRQVGHATAQAAAGR